MFICKRVLNTRTNLGKIYLVNIYNIIKRNRKLNTIWLTKKKGTSCGTVLLKILDTILKVSYFSLRKIIMKTTKYGNDMLRKLKYRLNYATYSNKNAIIRANNPVASEKANPKIA